MSLMLTKRVKAYFAKPERKLAAMLPGLRQLRTDLGKISEMTDYLSAIVVFFNVVAKWQDEHRHGLYDLIQEFKRLDYGRYTSVISQLNLFDTHIRNAGREEFGMNRTKSGQAVTDDNVYLGNIYGLFTKTVAYWKTQKNQEKGRSAYPSLKNLNAYDVVSLQAHNFTESHIGPMTDIVNHLERLASR